MIAFKRGIASFTLMAMALALFGCSGSTGSGADSGVTAAQSGLAGKALEAQTRKVKDAKGEVEIPARPLRIADISGSAEELLVLGYRPIATGNTEMSNPKELTPISEAKAERRYDQDRLVSNRGQRRSDRFGQSRSDFCRSDAG